MKQGSRVRVRVRVRVWVRAVKDNSAGPTTTWVRVRVRVRVRVWGRELLSQTALQGLAAGI